MGLSTQQQVRYWGAAAAVFILFLWLMGNTLLPFVLGAAIAYLLDPAADRLEKLGLSRVAATALITVFAVVVLILSMLIVVPLVAQQIDGALQAMPGLIRDLRDYLTATFPQLFDENSGLRRILSGAEDSLKTGGVAVVQTLLSGSLAVLDFLLTVVLAPVVAFYLLLDWDRAVARIDDLVPREHVETVRRLARDIDEVLSGFVRGQLTVGLILGTFYAIALTVLGLKFGVLIGLFAGIISFIPFVGSVTGGIVSIGVGLVQFWGSWGMIVAVAAVFLVGQAVEGNLLTPKMVGDRVKLHPVWLMFALSAFGSLMGFVGMLIAVPVAAVIGVLGRFAIDQYKGGRLYSGPKSRDAAE